MHGFEPVAVRGKSGGLHGDERGGGDECEGVFRGSRSAWGKGWLLPCVGGKATNLNTYRLAVRYLRSVSRKTHPPVCRPRQTKGMGLRVRGR